MRLRIFGRVLYLRKGVLLFFLVLMLVSASAVLYFAEKNSGLPEIEREITASDEGSTERKADGVDPEGSDSILKSTDSPAPSPAPTADLRIAVHITGAVAEEGVYWLAPGSIVQDAVELCGGLMPDADTYYINLAMKVNDGMRIHIPSKNSSDKTWLLDVGYASLTGSEGTGAGVGGGLVNINTASVNELITLNGIGESTARDIIAFREEHGRFETIEDIMNVPGIKEAKFAKIKKYITV